MFIIIFKLNNQVLGIYILNIMYIIQKKKKN